MGLLALPVLYPYGNIPAVDAYFFGASASTESGLNTSVDTTPYTHTQPPLANGVCSFSRIDVKELKTYQQLYIYFIPMLTHLGFINIIVVVVRLFWFERHLKRLGEPTAHLISLPRLVTNTSPLDTAPQLLHDRRGNRDADVEQASEKTLDTHGDGTASGNDVTTSSDVVTQPRIMPESAIAEGQLVRTTTITFDPSTESHRENDTLYIPGPRARERGM